MTFKVSVIRPDDLLNLQVEGRNLQIDTSIAEAPALIPEDATQVAYLIVHFPPQTIAEETFYESRPDIEGNPPPPSTNKPDDPEKVRRDLPKPPENAVKNPAKARIGQPSRLVFQLPANSNPHIPYTTEGLLNWTGLELSVTPVAAMPEKLTPEQLANAPAIAPPTELETAIEMPYRLILSPNRNVVWTHATTPKTHAGRTELWHTRLAYRNEDKIVDFSRIDPASLRAIWSSDYVAKSSRSSEWPILGNPDLWAAETVLTAMNARDRHELVILTSAFRGFIAGENDFTTYQPKPIYAEQVMLSSLGGWLKSRGSWNPPIEWLFRFPVPIDPIPLNPDLANPENAAPAVIAPEEPVNLIDLLNPALRDVPLERIGDRFRFPPILLGENGQSLNISEWVHVATQGRDHYVRIVYEGYLYPFGHRAALVKVTERKFKEVNSTPFAYLAQRMFIVVRQPLKDYTQQNSNQEALPNEGRQMPLKQLRLTTLVTPDIEMPIPIGGTQYSFWVRVGGQDFQFHAVGQDSEQHAIDFTTALIFVPNSDANAVVDIVRTEYNAPANEARKACLVPGQSVTYAERNGDPSDNTTLTTRALYFDTDNATLAKFLPKLDKAAVNLTAVEQLVGTATPTEIKYFTDYLVRNFDSGNEVFAKLVKEVKSEFSADKAGGIATPNLSITGLTRKLGAVSGDLSKAATNSFVSKDFFKDFKDAATLFGKIKLTELLADGDYSNAPKIQFFPQENPPKVKLDWKPTIQNVEAGFFKFIREAGSQLEIEGSIEQPIDGNAGKSLFTGSLTNFYLEFFNVIKLSFDAFRFRSETRQKTDVNVQLKSDNALEFLGDLEFVNDLKSIIPPGLFGDGPSLELTPQPAIRAGFSIGLPPVEVGVFALKDVALGAALTLPFLNGSPLFDFNISERQRPFNLTIAFFGGGGFFRLQLDTLAIRVIEASFEFGASASINLGVASGGVYIMAGIYFKLETKPDGKKKATLTGFFRMGGNLSVLGLISVSLEFNLSFTYEEVGKATGRATLTVKVKVLFISKSFEITVEKTFGGGKGDPIFAQVWDAPEIWNDYAGSFA